MRFPEAVVKVGSSAEIIEQNGDGPDEMLFQTFVEKDMVRQPSLLFASFFFILLHILRFVRVNSQPFLIPNVTLFSVRNLVIVD